MALVAEFIVEPFVPGSPGPHVTAAIHAARAAGAAADVGAFGTRIRADSDAIVLDAIDAALRSAIAAGATGVSVRVAVDGSDH